MLSNFFQTFCEFLELPLEENQLDFVTAALTGIKTMSDILTAIKDFDKQMDAVQYKDKILELSQLLIETKGSVLELQKTIPEKDTEIAGLVEKLKDKAEFIFEKYYYIQYKDGKRLGNPFCPRCYSENKKSPLLPSSVPGKWECCVCGITIFDDNVKETPSGNKWWSEELGLG
jgi:hypothetical protein